MSSVHVSGAEDAGVEPALVERSRLQREDEIGRFDLVLVLLAPDARDLARSAARPAELDGDPVFEQRALDVRVRGTDLEEGRPFHLLRIDVAEADPHLVRVDKRLALV